MLALITAALQGLAALKEIYFEIKSGALASTLNEIKENQQKILAGHLAMAEAKDTPEELRAALRKIHRSK